MKKAFKRAIFYISSMIVSPLVITDKIEKYFTKSEQAFVFMGMALSLIPGTIGSYVRAAYYFFTLNDCSWEFHIGFGSIVTHRAAKIERHSSIGMYCILGCVRIGEDVMLANRVSIPSGKYQHLADSGEINHENRMNTVLVGKGSWIGESSVILADVGEDCIVGAGSVVVKPFSSNNVIAGNPAKIIRRRGSIF